MLLVIVSSLAMAEVRAAEAGAAATPPAARYVPEKLQSAILGEERRAIVRLPRGYDRDATARHPVLFKLDGDGGLKSYEEALDALGTTGAAPGVILVVIPNGRGQRERDMTPASLHQDADPTGKMGTGEMGRGDRFLEFLDKELVPLIDQRYRTSPVRILAGHSRSALLVVQSLISQPGLFQGRFIFSAPLLRDEQRLITDLRQSLAAQAGLQSFVYFNWGESENAGMSHSCTLVQQLLTEKAPTKLRWVIERSRGADHQTTPLLAIPSALQEFFAAPDKRLPNPAANQIRIGQSTP